MYYREWLAGFFHMGRQPRGRTSASLSTTRQWTGHLCWKRWSRLGVQQRCLKTSLLMIFSHGPGCKALRSQARSMLRRHVGLCMCGFALDSRTRHRNEQTPTHEYGVSLAAHGT